MKYLIVNILLYLTVKFTFCACINGTNETSRPNSLVTSNVTGIFYRIPKTTTCRYSSVKPSLKKNLILLGLEKVESHSQHLRMLVLDVLIYEAKNELNENDIAQVYRLETKNEDTEKPPILIIFREEQIRNMVFKNRFHLNSTRFRLNIDLSKKNYHRQKELQPLKQKIKDLGMQCQVCNGRLFVDGKEYSKEEIDKLIAKARLQTTSTPLKSGFIIRTRHSLSWRK